MPRTFSFGSFGVRNAPNTAILAWAPARIPLGVLVRHRRAERGKDRRARVVLGGDQPQLAALALELSPDRLGHLGVGRLQHLPVGRVLPHLASRSICVICSILALCRPPSKGVASHTRTISSARVGATMRAPIPITFASLC